MIYLHPKLEKISASWYTNGNRGGVAFVSIFFMIINNGQCNWKKKLNYYNIYHYKKLSKHERWNGTKMCKRSITRKNLPYHLMI